MYTIKQVSQIAGVTPRTLRHYDSIGLFKPTRIGENGYRYYSEDSLLQLQQILLYRELGMPLDEIKKITGRSDFDVMNALEGHKSDLLKRIEQVRKLVKTVEHTISHLRGEREMNSEQLFDYLQKIEENWSQSLDRLAEYLEKN